MMKFKFFKGDTRTQNEILDDMLEAMDRAINRMTELNNQISNLNDSAVELSITLNDLIKDYEL